MAKINTKISKEVINGTTTFVFEATLEKMSFEYEIDREALILDGYQETESDRIFVTMVKRIVKSC